MFDGTLMFLAYFEDEVGGSIDGSCGAVGATVLLSSVLFFGLNMTATLFWSKFV